ncbi:hypothetical protein NKH77_34365 [Streptomyces sp. M19]
MPVFIFLGLLFGGTGATRRNRLNAERPAGPGTHAGLLVGYLVVMIFVAVVWLPVWWLLCNLAVLGACLTVVLRHTWHVGAVLRGNLAPPGRPPPGGCRSPR